MDTHVPTCRQQTIQWQVDQEKSSRCQTQNRRKLHLIHLAGWTLLSRHIFLGQLCKQICKGMTFLMLKPDNRRGVTISARLGPQSPAIQSLSDDDATATAPNTTPNHPRSCHMAFRRPFSSIRKCSPTNVGSHEIECDHYHLCRLS